MLKASNPDSGDFFSAAAYSGNTIVVGAPGEDSPSSGFNGAQGNNNPLGSNSGAVYIFERSGSTWEQVDYVKASTRGVNDGFGARVAIDGDTIAVAAYGEDSGSGGINGNQSSQTERDSGAVYVLVRENGEWSQQAYIKASHPERDDLFGISIALEGDTLVVGASGEDSAATGVNGDPTNNDAQQSGAAYIFERSGRTWSQAAYLKASNTDGGDLFGQSVDISGSRVVVGATREASAGMGPGALQADNSTLFAGAAYTFVRSGTTWAQESYIKASNTGFGDFFGGVVKLDGQDLVIGAQGESSGATGVNGNQADDSLNFAGAAYAFQRFGGQWVQTAYLKASATQSLKYFGNCTSLFNGTLIVRNGNGGGTLDVFEKVAGNWEARGELDAPFNVPKDALSPQGLDDEIIVFSHTDRSSVPGVHSCLGDTQASASGVVFVVERSPLAQQSICSPAVPNSSTVPAYVSAYGSLDLTQNELTLRADNLPANSIGMFLNSRGQGLVPMAGGSQGSLCLGGGQPVGRHTRPNEIGMAGARCWIDLRLDLGALPSGAGTVPVVAGETWYFQAWYRDNNPTATSNFTDAVALTF